MEGVKKVIIQIRPTARANTLPWKQNCFGKEQFRPIREIIPANDAKSREKSTFTPVTKLLQFPRRAEKVHSVRRGACSAILYATNNKQTLSRNDWDNESEELGERTFRFLRLPKKQQQLGGNATFAAQRYKVSRRRAAIELPAIIFSLKMFSPPKSYRWCRIGTTFHKSYLTPSHPTSL